MMTKNILNDQPIVSGASTLPCPIAAVIYILCWWLVGSWSVIGQQTTIRVVGLWEVSFQKDHS
jgi:hypothetical protein